MIAAIKMFGAGRCLWTRFSQTTKGEEFLKKAWAAAAGGGGASANANVSARLRPFPTLVRRRV